MNKSVTYQELKKMVGQEIGVSEWVLIDQARIDAFAHVTIDEQFVHTDPVAAQATPFGGTIAHGFLTLSLLSHMGFGFNFGLMNTTMVVNYGFEKIRFINAVRSGSRVRGRFTLGEAIERAPGQIMGRFTVTVEIEGQTKPALVADWLTLQFPNSAGLQQGAA